MAKKILLACGCSYTDKNYISFDKEIPEDQQGGWKFWPEIMAEDLGLQCLNVARSGRGADYIFNETVKQITTYGDRIDTVAVLWSGSDRTSFYSYDFNPLVEIDDDPSWVNKDGTKYDPFSWMDDIGIGKVNRNFWKSVHFNKNIYYQMMENQLIKMVALLDLCISKNIKLVMGQGLIFFNYHTLENMYQAGRLHERAYLSSQEVFDYLFKNPFFPYLEKNKKYIIGWPFSEKFGGTTFDHIRFEKEQYFISARDRHPNAACQKLWAGYFIERHKQLYG